MSLAAAGKAIELKRIHDKRFGTELTDSDGWTPIFWAAVNDRSSAIDALCERGANVSAVDKNGATALHWAAVNGSSNAIHNLLKRGLKVTAKDKQGRTPVQLAWEYGQEISHEVMRRGRSLPLCWG
ncbi:hypothetical protein GUITHDRAFT_64811 [Guillardia theta CCMP2712]|uniref:Uncharacterized protein n=1 Tax=Guillardia theta (strain CCMP2712) TaxID=905079 RepID=L1JXZ7_GUITC|nr:hypothetical protein GUITHDRAFT_64811 [Guillardia theta CCMP2712]EKX52968.1 hypothetical protein GUITHDRAFT_64811 [Guillardia theta CCMP2712]|eukprot:XP_005839948.1 hypothetical protein GUITHDRAFT_64811 [Guillardia theta CCMP2712]